MGVAAKNLMLTGLSFFFVSMILLMYYMHCRAYDHIKNSEDYSRLSALLEDDDGITTDSDETIENPNRLLKALARTSKGNRARVVTWTCFALFVLLVGEAVVVDTMVWENCWGWPDIDVESSLGEAPPVFFLVMLIMLCFCTGFELIYARETQSVMPSTSDGSPWDPISHGVPPAFRLFGLPAMWFTSQEAHDDLKLWITHAQRHHDNYPVAKIYPEEMALFALNGNGGCILRKTLLHAKFYSVDYGQFLSRDSRGRPCQLRDGAEPTELDVDLVFYDKVSMEYLQPEETYAQGQVHLLPGATFNYGASIGRHSLASLGDEDLSPGPQNV